nr:zinc-ribbon domain-containing protein [Desulforamulus aquiferis]
MLNEQIAKLTPKPPICPKCNAELPEEAKYCPACGDKVTE